MVRRELDEWFASFAPDGAPRVRPRRPGADRGPRGVLHRRQRLRGARAPGSRCRSGRCPTPRTRCWRATCWPRAGPRPTIRGGRGAHSHDYGPRRAPAALLRRGPRAARGQRPARPRRPGAPGAWSSSASVRDDLALAAPRGRPAGGRARAPGRWPTTRRAPSASRAGLARRPPARRRAPRAVAGRARGVRPPMLNRLSTTCPRRAR